MNAVRSAPLRDLPDPLFRFVLTFELLIFFTSGCSSGFHYIRCTDGMGHDSG